MELNQCKTPEDLLKFLYENAHFTYGGSIEVAPKALGYEVRQKIEELLKID